MRGTFQILLGDVRERLRDLPAKSVHCVVTSPPYLGLRDYGIEGQIGRESTWQEHLAVLGDVFAEVHRVLRTDGTLWLNYGDAYAQRGRSATPEERENRIRRTEERGYHTGAFGANNGWDRAAGTATGGLKPKDLMGLPWRLALSLQDAGWWLRADNIWAKTNPTPEPPRGRPTVSHEYVFLLAKAERYFYDGDAVRVPGNFNPHGSGWTESTAKIYTTAGPASDPKRIWGREGSRNLWTVWRFPTQAFPAQDECDHFATFPEELARTCILAGSSEKGCCPACGAPWRRVLEPTEAYRECLGQSWNDHQDDLKRGQRKTDPDGFAGAAAYQTTGWEPTCQCPAAPPVPCTVLDPFAGSGTAGVVALRLGRSFVGVELNPDYHRLATRRLETALFVPPVRAPKRRADDPQLSLFSLLENDSNEEAPCPNN